MASLGNSLCEVIVDDNVVEKFRLRELKLSLGNTFLNDILAISSTRAAVPRTRKGSLSTL